MDNFDIVVVGAGSAGCIITNQIINNTNYNIIFGDLIDVVKFIYTSKNTNLFTIINVYWGFAGWSRTQLLAEIARGGWGMCHGEINDLMPINKNIWEDIYNTKRILFAPKTEYSNKYNKHI